MYIDDSCAFLVENKGNSSVMNECVNICSSCKNHLCQTNSTNKSFYCIKHNSNNFILLFYLADNLEFQITAWLG